MHIDYALEVLKIVNYLKWSSPKSRKNLTERMLQIAPPIKVLGGKPTRNY